MSLELGIALIVVAVLVLNVAVVGAIWFATRPRRVTPVRPAVETHGARRRVRPVSHRDRGAA